MWFWIGITVLLVFGWEVIPFLLVAAVVFGPFIVIGVVLRQEYVARRAARRRAAAQAEQLEPYDPAAAER
jgi:Flp pilus assembly protein protease CpaA